MQNIHAKAMLVDLNISQWTGRKIDRRATQQVAQMNGVDVRVGTYYKSLLDGKELEPIKQLVGAARNYHYRMTLPWSDAGPRILSSQLYFEYMGEMQLYRSRFDSLYQDFEQRYALARAEAQRTLGPLFNEDDYPTLGALASKFSFELNVLPLPVADDFRVDLGDDEVERLKKRIEESTKASLAGAVSDMCQRLTQVVDAFIDRLGKEENIFRDSLVENARQLASLLPKLNVTDDPRIEELCRKLEDKLCQYEPQTLRDNPATRKATWKAAKELKSDLLDFFGTPA